MGDLNSGLLTLIVFGVLALFGVVAFLSLRRNIRGIQAPTAAELEAQRSEEAEEAAPPQAVLPQRPGRGARSQRSPKASSRS